MAKLAGAYERLGDLYTSTGRFTRAHQHYKQVGAGPVDHTRAQTRLRVSRVAMRAQTRRVRCARGVRVRLSALGPTAPQGLGGGRRVGECMLPTLAAARGAARAQRRRPGLVGVMGGL